MGDRDDDDGRLRRHDAQDVRRHVRRVVLRAHRRPHHRTSGSGRSATTRHRTSGSGEREIARTRDQSSASALVSTVWSCLSLRLETTRFGRDSTPEIILAPAFDLEAKLGLRRTRRPTIGRCVKTCRSQSRPQEFRSGFGRGFDGSVSHNCTSGSGKQKTVCYSTPTAGGFSQLLA